MKVKSVRLFFIYASFATLIGGFVLYLTLAFWIKLKDMIYTKRSSVSICKRHAFFRSPIVRDSALLILILLIGVFGFYPKGKHIILGISRAIKLNKMFHWINLFNLLFMILVFIIDKTYMII